MPEGVRDPLARHGESEVRLALVLRTAPGLVEGHRHSRAPGAGDHGMDVVPCVPPGAGGGARSPAERPHRLPGLLQALAGGGVDARQRLVDLGVARRPGQPLRQDDDRGQPVAHGVVELGGHAGLGERQVPLLLQGSGPQRRLPAAPLGLAGALAGAEHHAAAADQREGGERGERLRPPAPGGPRGPAEASGRGAHRADRRCRPRGGVAAERVEADHRGEHQERAGPVRRGGSVRAHCDQGRRRRARAAHRNAGQAPR